MAFQADFQLLSAPVVTAVVLVAVGLFLRSRIAWRSRTRGLPLPPGPRALPLLGNMFNMPSYKPWEAYRELAAQYGDIMHFHIPGESFVVLNDPNLILEYLEKKSANSSDRPQSPLLKISGHDISLAFMPYDQWWRRHRRAFWQYFNHDMTVKYQPVQRAVTQEFLGMLLEDPSQLTDYIQFTFEAAVLKIVYGITPTVNDIYLSMASVALESVSQGLIPGKWLMEIFPSLQYVPTWLPGTSTQKLFKTWKNAHDTLKNITFEYAKKHMDQEEVSQSVAAQLLNGLDHSKVTSIEEEEDVIKNVGAVTILAGADTSFSTLQAALLALSLYPDVVKKAQAELDAVVGPHRLPDFSDEDSLPYIQAIVLESLRWHNVVPLGVPHRTSADDEFHGYFIPAGTNIIPNTWACLHDPEVYPEPDAFRPDRFLKDGKLDPTVRNPASFAFGYGRRLCPGRYFALAGIFINVASVLHVFDLSPPLDKNGIPIVIKPAMSNGFLSYPEDCRCTIKPRSDAAIALIRSREE